MRDPQRKITPGRVLLAVLAIVVALGLILTGAGVITWKG